VDEADLQQLRQERLLPDRHQRIELGRAQRCQLHARDPLHCQHAPAAARARGPSAPRPGLVLCGWHAARVPGGPAARRRASQAPQACLHVPQGGAGAHRVVRCSSGVGMTTPPLFRRAKSESASSACAPQRRVADARHALAQHPYTIKDAEAPARSLHVQTGAAVRIQPQRAAMRAKLTPHENPCKPFPQPH